MYRELEDCELTRYSRQILLTGFDIAGQQRLINSRALIVGAGGLGCSCAQYLVAAGLGELLLLDDDRVDSSNLPRQILYTEADLGRPKVDSAAESLRQLNSTCIIEARQLRLNGDDNIDDLLYGVDILVDCSDNLAARRHLNRLSLQAQIPLVSGAAIRMEGQVACFDPRRDDSPCYTCLSMLSGEHSLRCVEAGVLSPLVGVVGSMQALEAIKLVTGYGKPAVGTLQLFDALEGNWRQFRVPRRSDCASCAGV